MRFNSRVLLFSKRRFQSRMRYLNLTPPYGVRGGRRKDRLPVARVLFGQQEISPEGAPDRSHYSLIE